MSDYNDGKWHGHNGGECPVHSESVVDFFSERDDWFGKKSGDCDWSHCGGFRVIKPYVEPAKPREFWLHNNDLTVSFSRRDANIYEQGLGCNHGYIHVREVLPND